MIYGSFSFKINIFNLEIGSSVLRQTKCNNWDEVVSSLKLILLDNVN